MGTRRKLRVGKILAALWNWGGVVAWLVKAAPLGGATLGGLLGIYQDLAWWQAVLLVLAAALLAPALVWFLASVIRVVAAALTEDVPSLDVQIEDSSRVDSPSMDNNILSDSAVQQLATDNARQAGRDYIEHQVVHHSPPAPDDPTVLFYSNGRFGYVKVTNNGPKERFSLKLRNYAVQSDGSMTGECRPTWWEGTETKEIRRGDDAYALIVELEWLDSIIKPMDQYYPKQYEADMARRMKRHQTNKAVVRLTGMRTDLTIDIGKQHWFELVVIRDNLPPFSTSVTLCASSHSQLHIPCEDASIYGRDVEKYLRRQYLVNGFVQESLTPEEAEEYRSIMRTEWNAFAGPVLRSGVDMDAILSEEGASAQET